LIRQNLASIGRPWQANPGECGWIVVAAKTGLPQFCTLANRSGHQPKAAPSARGTACHVGDLAWLSGALAQRGRLLAARDRCGAAGAAGKGQLGLGLLRTLNGGLDKPGFHIAFLDLIRGRKSRAVPDSMHAVFGRRAAGRMISG
jgi:hypothetical protein